MSRKAMRQKFGSIPTVLAYLESLSVNCVDLSGQKRTAPPRRRRKSDYRMLRDLLMLERYLRGETHEEIGGIFGLSRSRVCERLNAIPAIVIDAMRRAVTRGVFGPSADDLERMARMIRRNHAA